MVALGLHRCMGFSPGVVSRCYSVVAACGTHTHCRGFSSCGAQAVGEWASVVVAHGLSRPVACGMPPDPGIPPGIKPVSPVLVGSFFTTEPPGRPMSQLPAWLSPHLGSLG